MKPTAIFGPFLALMLVTLLVWLYMYARRIPFIVRSRLSPEQLVPAEFNRLSPPAIRNPSDNLKNLFEIPTLFYGLCLYLFVTGGVDQAHLVAAWLFVGFRVLHSVVHCTFNHVRLRFTLYAISSIAFFFMLLRAAIAWASPS